MGDVSSGGMDSGIARRRAEHRSSTAMAAQVCFIVMGRELMTPCGRVNGDGGPDVLMAGWKF
jgi:hypothetical protein